MCSCCSHWQSTTSVLRPHVLDASRVHQHDLESPFLQNPEQRYPVHPGGLHDHGLHSALRKPVSQAVQVRREGLKLLHRRLRPVGRYRRHSGWWRPRRCPPNLDSAGTTPPVSRCSGVCSSFPPRLLRRRDAGGSHQHRTIYGTGSPCLGRHQ